jgi:periplasmic divalent cation tolerance protein
MVAIMVFVTVASKQEAKGIVRLLLRKRLIACANILGPVKSEFWWQSKIDKAKEFLVLMKSDEKLFEKLSRAVKEMHSYEVPEIVAVPIVKGWQPYMDWLNASLQPTSKR